MATSIGNCRSGFRAAWPLLLPFFLCFALFWVIPLLGGVKLSLHSNTLYGESTFVGLDHYRQLAGDSRYFKAIKNTAVYTVSALVVILPLAMLLACGLRGLNRRLRAPLGFLLLLPGLTPPAVLGLLFLLVFHGREGLLNQWFVMPLGFAPINWLKDPAWILPALVLQMVWRWTGFIAFFLLAAMEAVPRVYYEVAELETRRRWPVFRSITLPALGHVVAFCCVYLVVDAFSMFSGAYVLLGGSGGTADAGLLLVSYGYQKAFPFGNFGTAAAMSLAVAPLLLGLLGLIFLLPKARAAR